MSMNHSGYYNWGGGAATTTMYGVDSRDAVKHPTMYRTAPNAKNYLVQNVNTAEVEKFCYIFLLVYCL